MGGGIAADAVTLVSAMTLALGLGGVIGYILGYGHGAAFAYHRTGAGSVTETPPDPGELRHTRVP